MHNTAIQIRWAQPADYSKMKIILSETFESTWRPQVTQASADHYITTDIDGRLVDDHGAAMRVAVMAGDIAGLIYWRKNFIESVHVATRFQRLGVGQSLLADAEREIAQAGYAAARLQTDTFNKRSRAFYSRLGYAEIDRYPDDEWDSGLTTILFEKRLS